ncbi:DUF4229 domain-containing protein [Amnibacterium flavum]|uniref:DUF4229 domain-containing protein n=1 Tax=Amnibacterium flavum TaxID=2173173 RepID=UPI00140318D9|nr:DUF4229 domain-containing protein [Amnibacterium flavum]
MEPRPRSRWTLVWYTLIRLGIFAVVLTVLLIVLPIEPWISTIIAAVIAFCVSYIFLSKPRAVISEQIATVRSGAVPRSADSDDAVEDAAVGDAPAAGDDLRR